MLFEFIDGAISGLTSALIVAIVCIVVRRDFAGATRSWFNRLAGTAVPVAFLTAIIIVAFGGELWSIAQMLGNTAGLFVGYTITAPIIRNRVFKNEAVAIEPEELDDKGNPLPGWGAENAARDKEQRYENYPKNSS